MYTILFTLLVDDVCIYQWPNGASFLPRDALVHSAVLRLHVVRPSVGLSVTLVDQDHIRWKSWKLIARTLLAQHIRSS